jgi:polyisoprenoid-binding protein YceI
MAQTARETEGQVLPQAGTYVVDPAHSSVEFVARHMLSKVRGRFTDSTATVEIAERPGDSSVEAVVKTASVQTNQEMRDNHLKGEDFFDVEKYPELTFKSTGVKITGDSGFELAGDLTIRDVTKPVTFRGEFLGFGPNPQGVPTIFASAKTTVAREDWGLNWNMAVETGGFLVGKKVDLELEIQANLQS